MLQTIVIEDSESQARLLGKHLEQLGCECTIARSAAAAKALIRSKPFDLAVVDFGLPDSSGIDILWDIVEICDPRPFILAITARSEGDYIDAALESGADDYLIKGAGQAQLDVRLKIAVRNAEHRKRDRDKVDAQIRDLSEQQMETLLLLEETEDISRVGGWVLYPDAEGPQWSRVTHEIHGTDADTYRPTLEEAISFYHPDDIEMVKQTVQEAVTKCDGWEFEARIIAKGGIERWVHSRGKVIAADGKTEKIYGSFQDVTEKRKQAAALAESEQRFRDVAEALGEFVWESDENSRLTFISGPAEAVFGLSVEELIGKCPYDFMPEEEREGVRNSVREARASGSGFYLIEHSIINARGERKWMRVTGIPKLNKEGVATAYRGAGLDITKERETLNQLKLSEERWQYALAGSDDGLWDWNLRDNSVYFSSRWKSMLGHEDHEVANDLSEWEKRVHPDDLESCFADITAHLEGRSPSYQNEHRMLHKDGSYRWILDRGKVFEWDEEGKPSRMVGTHVDITEQIEMREELQREKDRAESATRAKSEFLANVSHEIRTPLNGVLGLAQILLDTELTRQQRDHVKMIVDSGGALLAVLNDVLDFSKIEAGKLELTSETFDIESVVLNVLRLIARQVQHKDIHLLCRIAPDIPPALYGDSGRLRQILLNLLGNAAKFTESGKISIQISRGDDEKGEPQLRIAVEDSGIGISAERIGTIFDSFTQEDASTSRKYGGTGLGLAICSRLAHLMGGEIRAESRLGKGSTFHLTLPLHEGEKGELPAQSEPAQDTLPSVVLLGGDEDSSAWHGCLLEEWGLHVSASHHAKDACTAGQSALESGAGSVLVLIVAGADPAEVSELLSMCPEDAPIFYMVAGRSRDHDALMRLMGSKVVSWSELPMTRRVFFDALTELLEGKASPASASAKRESEIRERSSMHSPDKKRVLLVEDNPVNQLVAKKMLAALNLDVEVAENGSEAVTMAEAGNYDLVLMDCQMPVMDGYEATQTIRDVESKASLPRLPIVAMTASAMAGDKERCIEAGMDDFIPKPVRREELASVLGKYLEVE